MVALDRDTLSSGEYLMSFKEVLGAQWWPQERIEASMQEILGRRPGTEPVWLFAYGSLIWNPQFHFVESVPSLLEGWRRSFSIRLVVGRGSMQQPGRMMSLSPGGRTQGLALCLAEETLEQELRMVWLREMVAGTYQPDWARIVLADGRRVWAIVFTANPGSVLHESDDSVETIAPLIAAAHGTLGSNQDYVLQLDAALRRHGFEDDYIHDLAAHLMAVSP